MGSVFSFEKSEIYRAEIYCRQTVVKDSIQHPYILCENGYRVELDENKGVIPNEDFTEMGDPIVTNICNKCGIGVHQCDGADTCKIQSGITCDFCSETACFACSPTFQKVHSAYLMQEICCNACFDRIWGLSREKPREDYGKCRYDTCRACR